jgi:hypothetical protein
MNEYEKYYYYDKKNDCVVECAWNEYMKIDPKVRDDQKIKCDKFNLGCFSYDVKSWTTKNYTISTICLMKDHAMAQTSITPLIFETMIFSDDKDYDGYIKRYTSLKEAKFGHDWIILKIKRREALK